MINLHERMLPTSSGVEPATSWSPVGRRIQLSHRGQLCCLLTDHLILYKVSTEQSPHHQYTVQPIIHTYIHIHTYIRTNACMHAHTHEHTCMYAHTHTQTYIHMHTYIHTYNTHTYIHTPTPISYLHILYLSKFSNR